MIPFDFEYFKPASAAEAIQLFWKLEGQGKQPLYYAGGTEIITFGRLGLVTTGAVIDVKGIPETHVLGFEGNWLLTGASVTLTDIEEAGLFPLLGRTSSEVADRTARNKITLGGNICGQIFYREAVLPFLLADSELAIAGRTGMKRHRIQDVFNRQLRLERGDCLLYLLTDKAYLSLPHRSVKVRKQWDVGYPLITIAAIKKDDRIRIAISGLCPFPFRSSVMEDELNNRQLPLEDRIDRALRSAPTPILNDMEGSSEYRLFVLRNTLTDMITELEGTSDGHA